MGRQGGTLLFNVSEFSSVIDNLTLCNVRAVIQNSQLRSLDDSFNDIALPCHEQEQASNKLSFLLLCVVFLSLLLSLAAGFPTVYIEEAQCYPRGRIFIPSNELESPSAQS
jgi:hypothetical protein